MHQADSDALKVLQKLQQLFGSKNEHILTLKVPEGVLVGFEIEVPWRAYFPDLWKQYFHSGRRTYSEMTAAEQQQLTTDCSVVEAALLPLLNETVICGLPKGNDRYWEFAFPPVQSLSIVCEMINVLVQAGLIPWGPYSLHATFSGVTSQKDMFVVLLILELLYGKKERIESGLVGWGAWARKGSGGIKIKSGYGSKLTFGSNEAFELRTLQLPETYKHFACELRTITQLLTTMMYNKEVWERLCQNVEVILADHQLPFTIWPQPRENMGVWKHYIEVFDELRLKIARQLQEVLPN